MFNIVIISIQKVKWRQTDRPLFKKYKEYKNNKANHCDYQQFVVRFLLHFIGVFFWWVSLQFVVKWGGGRCDVTIKYMTHPFI